MSKIKRLSVIALLLLTVGVVGGLLTYSSLIKQFEVKKDRIVKDTFTSVEINGVNADIDIIPTNDSMAKIEFVTNGVDERKSTLTSDVNGKILSITVKDNGGPFQFGFHLQSRHLKVLLPNKQYESIVIENGNGQVQVEQMKTNHVQVTLINGEAQLNGLITDSIRVESGNGEIRLKDVEGEITGSTVNGIIDVETKDLNRSLELKSANGKILVQTEKEPTNARFDISVLNGDINILDKYTGSTTIGKGENLIKLSTVNGEVSVTR